MATTYLPIQTTKIKGCIKLLLVLIVTLIAFSISLNTAAAQVHNLSDWNVPPPLPPGTITRGNTTGKPATAKPTILTPVDIPIPAQPAAPPVKMPYLAAIITTPPFAASPGGPDKLSIDPEDPDIPLPDAPDAPSLPQQTLQDKPTPEVIDLPLPASPEMPPLPQEPASSGQTSPGKLLIPLMPEVLSLKSPSLPPGNAPMYWPTPAIPGDISIKLAASSVEKAVKSRRKGKPKFKTKPLRI
ncbi:hypothetical protein [Mucilaginibacter sp.]|uniref:hypothetical protein n=1 Tax=Mucilaginibacter sp. TaxID=1882438 RepID=UPI0028521617|nr:hypothetical protein [Mucilaginibacter sp.]MDR3695417.1 hypothetical protein [Mucilaginibacter sp.]